MPGIAAATGNAEVSLLQLDLADLASVRRSAAEFLARGEPLHVLISNAGVAGRRGLTADGFELAFGVNHLGTFAFTTALLDRLASHGPARSSRFPAWWPPASGNGSPGRSARC
jgi:retinol dehydrogenase 12